MVNKGRIYMELRKILMISSNLIKSDNELMIEIGENGMKENFKTIPQNQKSLNLTLISRRNWRSKWDDFFET